MACLPVRLIALDVSRAKRARAIDRMAGRIHSPGSARPAALAWPGRVSKEHCGLAGRILPP